MRTNFIILFVNSNSSMDYTSHINDTLTTYIRQQSAQNNQILANLESIGKKSYDYQYHHCTTNDYILNYDIDFETQFSIHRSEIEQFS